MPVAWQRIEESVHRIAQVIQARSSAIHSLQWVLLLLFAAFVTLIVENAKTWALVFIAVLIGLIIILLVVAYVYFMFKNPDALRSEKYSLVKQAIEKHVLGDSVTGLREVVDNFEEVELPRLGGAESTDIGQTK